MLQSVTGLLRMSGFCVFQAHDGVAAEELCRELPDIDLLVLNTHGTALDNKKLVERVRAAKPGMRVLHIGSSLPAGLPADVPSLEEGFSADHLLRTVGSLLQA